MPKKDAKPEIKAKDIPRQNVEGGKTRNEDKRRYQKQTQKEAESELRAKGIPKTNEEEAKLKVRPSAWRLICPGAVSDPRAYECGADHRIMEAMEVLKREHYSKSKRYRGGHQAQ